jgi:NADH:ubiquinone oxidoreductase subunit B-like Fe-S oxidoreductase
MRSFFILLILLIGSTGCTKTPEVPSNTTIDAQNQIESNKNEAQQAQEEYLRLQRQRGEERR